MALKGDDDEAQRDGGETLSDDDGTKRVVIKAQRVAIVAKRLD